MKATTVAVVAALLVGACAAAAAAAAVEGSHGKLRISTLEKAAACTEADKARNGDRLQMHYRGTLLDGTVFDDSHNHGRPFEFVLGRGMVIRGWEEGVLGMCVGEKRRLLVPPSMGYGSHAVGPIPANSDLLFDVELVAIVNRPEAGAKREEL